MRLVRLVYRTSVARISGVRYFSAQTDVMDFVNGDIPRAGAADAMTVPGGGITPSEGRGNWLCAAANIRGVEALPGFADEAAAFVEVDEVGGRRAVRVHALRL